MGGTLYFLGNVLQIFVNSTWSLVLAYSIIQGSGFGLIVPTSYTTFNNYFVKKRVMWMSFAQSLIGVGTMAYPMMVQKLMEWYGFRGCLMIIAALNAHAILGMLLMQPVKWHMKRVPLTAEEMQQRQQQNQTQPRIEVTSAQTPEVLQNNDADASHLSPLVYSGSLRARPRKISREEELRVLSTRSSSIASLGNWSGPIVVSDASMTHGSISRKSSTRSSIRAGETLADPMEKLSIWQKIVNFLDLSLLKKPIYVNLVLGMSFALYSDLAFFTLQPMYLFELGFSMVRFIFIYIYF